MNSFKKYYEATGWFMAILLVAFAAGCTSGDSGTAGDTTAPTVSVTSPLDGATTGIAVNTNITATFSEAMDSSTITGTTFTLKQGITAVSGVISYSGTTATFNPNVNLTLGSPYTATVTTGVKDLAGNALAATKTWGFTPDTAVDITPPLVSATSPADGATIAAASSTAVTATFNEDMTVADFDTTTFTVQASGVVGVEPGNVAYDQPSRTATFTPASGVLAAGIYTARVEGVTDLAAGNALVVPAASGVGAIPNPWTFTVQAAGPAICTGTVTDCIDLGTSANYAILAEAAVTSVPTSNITGDVGLYPIAGSAYVLTCPEVTGVIYDRDDAGPACTVTDATGLNIAVNDKLAAYNDGFGRTETSGAYLNIGTPAGTLDAGVSPLAPGVYVWTSGITIPVDLTLSGNATDVWIFKVGGTVSLDAQVLLIGGALPQNVFWVASGGVTVGAGAHMEGVVLSAGDITLITGASANGRLLSATQVVLQQATVTQPVP